MWLFFIIIFNYLPIFYLNYYFLYWLAIRNFNVDIVNTESILIMTLCLTPIPVAGHLLVLLTFKP